MATTTTKKEKTEFGFASPEFKKILGDLVSTEPLNPAEEITKFNNVVKKKRI